MGRRPSQADPFAASSDDSDLLLGLDVGKIFRGSKVYHEKDENLFKTPQVGECWDLCDALYKRQSVRQSVVVRDFLFKNVRTLRGH